MTKITIGLTVLLLAACGGGGDGAAPDACASASCTTSDAAVDAVVAIDGPPADADTREHLSTTGLCANAACTEFEAGVVEFRPRWGLYSDGATKRRWIKLPPGTTIDTTDMDYWDYPVGTKLWKEFTRDGIRVETRLEEKTGPAEAQWNLVSYAWNAAQDDAIAVPDGVVNANGTQHDIPSKSDCRGCHNRMRPGRVLGFTALQLDYDPNVGGATPHLTTLDDAIASGMLSSNPTGAASPHFPLPGTQLDQDALGYLHANCGDCHNPHSDVFDVAHNMSLRLEVGKLATVQDTPTFATAVGKPGGTIGDASTLIAPMDPAHSIVIVRMNSTLVSQKMPKLGTETIDPDGQTTLTAWINSLAP